MESFHNLRIVLLGKTGSGKSSTGNTILGRDVFEVARFPVSTTKICVQETTKKGTENISVIDTPGLCNTSMTEGDLKAEIEKSLQMSAPGPHVFLLVIRLGRFTDEEKNTVKWIQKNFGEVAKRFTMMLLTGADQLNKPIEKYLQENQELEKLVNECEGGYHAFNNTEKKDGAQVNELLEKINAIVERNGGGYYTIEMFKKTRGFKRVIQIICVAVTLICGYGLYRTRTFWCDLLYKMYSIN